MNHEIDRHFYPTDTFAIIHSNGLRLGYELTPAALDAAAMAEIEHRARHDRVQVSRGGKS